jgi:perosamine synthetase
MLDEGISTRRAVMCIHREGPYENLVRAGSAPLDVSERCQDTHVILPLYVGLAKTDVDRVSDALATCLVTR